MCFTGPLQLDEDEVGEEELSWEDVWIDHQNGEKTWPDFWETDEETDDVSNSSESETSEEEDREAFSIHKYRAEIEDFISAYLCVADMILNRLQTLNSVQEVFEDNVPTRVAVKQIADYVQLEPGSMTNYVKEWPEPVFPKKGRRAALYSYTELRPILQRQFPHVNWPEFDSV